MPSRGITQPEAPTSAPSPVAGPVAPDFTAHFDGDAVLACSGELDPATEPDLRRSLDHIVRLGPDRVVVDLSQVSFFDAGAIGELISARAASRAAGGDLVVRSPSLIGRRLLSLVDLTDLIAGDSGRTTASSDAAGDLCAHRAELVAAWQAACATDRYGAVPPVFDPMAIMSAITPLFDDPSSATAAAQLVAAAVRRDGTSPATAVLQLWALSDVVRAWRETHRAGSEEEDRRRLGLDAALVAMASAALVELEQSTLLDPLTGLLNRRALDRDLLQALAAARRHRRCLSVVMIDIEGLKATNDHAGHAAGDAALRDVASTLASALRAGDDAYRVGGDEFVLVLPGTGPDHIHGVMQRLVVTESGAFTWGSAWVEVDDDDGTPDAERAARLLEQADHRMMDYRSRDRGRPGRVDEAVVPARTTAELVGRFVAGNRSSVVVDEARGLVAQHFGVGIDEASVMLDAFAAARRRSLSVVAAALLDRTGDVGRLAVHRPDQADHAPGARVDVDAGPAQAAGDHVPSVGT